ncbi:endonuclease/exonuclease/phosphatase family domain-containing protein 1-like [Pecten maximus]|uniref:endonuclease/exonuclease/phosphatase family domain-containing protein 1-like n=1 Tax=Pecten maximus TaxID=6579 RepID=UPI0014589A8E|nr:endonuclease/exonuclease/phosphatase family domain-containing protein 1-like [Pecten maximus]
MGAVNSCCIPRHTGSDCGENHTKTPKGKGHRRNLSATFNLSLVEDDPLQTLININFATEEELMTLPGINRATSQSIIEYRRQIGGFKKVEDLALVSGVGATKLNVIRNEICVSKKSSNTSGTSSSRGSSLSSSKQDLSVAHLNKEQPKKSATVPTLININTSNVFQLMKIKGVGQSLAENIVAYRDKKGPFSTVEDLVKVKGIGPSVLSTIKYLVTVEDNLSSSEERSDHRSELNGDLANRVSPPETRGVGLDNSQPRLLTASVENILDIIKPIVKNSKRPNVTPFLFKRKKRHAVRLASWNIERFSSEKADNIGVKEVVCLTVLENGLSLVAFQELADEEALTKICKELNNPSIPGVKKFQGHRGVWKCVVSKAAGRMYQALEYNGFLYDTSQQIELKSSALLEKAKNTPKSFVRKPFIGVFKIRKFDCVVVSVHLKATGLNNQDMPQLQKEIDQVPHVVEAIEDHYPGEKDIIMLGDFNLAPDKEDFNCLRDRNYSNCIPHGHFTNISNNNLKGSRTYDHIWISEQSKEIFTGYSAVVREGLSSPWIPNGWSWGGLISDHCPVWAEFYSNKDLDTADLSLSAETIKFAVGAD